jgi:hypothetical protein
LSTQAIPITPELYNLLEVDLGVLKDENNPWAASWLQILGTLEPDQRPAVLAALIRGLPGLYEHMRDLGNMALRRVVGTIGALDELAGVELPPPPPTLPDSLGRLFGPLALDEEE